LSLEYLALILYFDYAVFKHGTQPYRHQDSPSAAPLTLAFPQFQPSSAMPYAAVSLLYAQALTYA